MKYRIKNIRRESWVETEEKLFRPAEDVAPIILPEDEAVKESEDSIYIIPDEGSEEKTEETVLFTPPITPSFTQPKEEKKPLIPFLKTKESKIMAALIGGFALLLIIFIIIVLCLGSSDRSNEEDDRPNGSNSAADHTHDYNTIIVKEATCTEDGAVIEECSICKYSAEGEQTVDALGHKWKTDKTKTVEPTCEESGELHKTCERCKLTETEPQQAKGHTWIETRSTDATCTNEGLKEFRCTNCDEEKTETEPKKEHDLSDPVRTEPTCAEEGKEVAVCNDCGKEVLTLIDKLPHDLEDATCESGEKCKVCGEEVTEPLGHKYDKGVCTVCGKESNTGSQVTAGSEMTVAKGLHVMVDSYVVHGGKVVLGISMTVTKEFSPEAYYITPEKISLTDPSGANVVYTAADDLFNLPSSGTVRSTVTVDYSGSGDYVLTIIGANGLPHSCAIAIE